MKHINKYTLLTIFATAVVLLSCKKRNQGIPYVPVDVYLNINNPGSWKLTSIGGWDYFNGGSKGLIIYRRGQDDFRCYDRHCTYNFDDPCGSAKVDSNNVEIKCSCDGSRYLLYDGGVANGPATLPLHTYNYDWNGQVLHVYN